MLQNFSNILKQYYDIPNYDEKPQSNKLKFTFIKTRSNDFFKATAYGTRSTIYVRLETMVKF